MTVKRSNIQSTNLCSAIPLKAWIERSYDLLFFIRMFNFVSQLAQKLLWLVEKFVKCTNNKDGLPILGYREPPKTIENPNGRRALGSHWHSCPEQTHHKLNPIFP